MKVRLAYLYRDSVSVELVLLDEGQDFDALYREFNRLDQAFANGETNNYLGFTAFMESKGVKIVDHESDSVANFGDKK